MSLAQLGADVTGVDISPTAIAAAQTLAEETGIPARFVVADLYDWLPTQEPAFDVVFMTYGALLWMSDIDALFAALARVLKPGGRCIGLEFHPLAMMYEQGRLTYPYSGGAHVVGETGVGDYVAASGTALAPSGFVEGQVGFKNPHATNEFSWGVADILGAQLRAGLVLEVVREYLYANGCKIWPDLVEQPGRRYAPPAARCRRSCSAGRRAGRSNPTPGSSARCRPFMDDPRKTHLAHRPGAFSRPPRLS
ncbi:class I SAM-dependent methyltransferase [Nannocystis pusilla]|uniref:class I SAM-dependent methyltransferase n=1 Tax=Nannocystis pusilla TaxID=889268 RepID=UPI003B80B99A